MDASFDRGVVRLYVVLVRACSPIRVRSQFHCRRLPPRQRTPISRKRLEPIVGAGAPAPVAALSVAAFITSARSDGRRRASCPLREEVPVIFRGPIVLTKKIKDRIRVCDSNIRHVGQSGMRVLAKDLTHTDEIQPLRCSRWQGGDDIVDATVLPDEGVGVDGRHSTDGWIIIGSTQNTKIQKRLRV
jgi:hypothetical protein